MAQAGDGKARSEKRKREFRYSRRVTDHERQTFEDRAKAVGFGSGQEYLAAFISGEIGRGVKMQGIQTLGQLGKIGSNINQIAHAINSGKAETVSPSDVQVIRDAISAIEHVGSEIRELLK